MPKPDFSVEEQGAHNRSFVDLQISILITKLFKSNLTSLDKLKATNNIAEESSTQARKEILDAGNETIRDLSNLINVFDFFISPERLAEAKFPRKTVKKVIVSGVTEVI